MWPWVSPVLSSPRCRFSLSGGGWCGWTATVVAGRAVALCRSVAGWCGSFGVCGGLIWLDPRLASLAWCCRVLWYAVLHRVVF